MTEHTLETKRNCHVEAIAQNIADRSPYKKASDNYARVFQAAFRGATEAIEAGGVQELVEAARGLLAMCDEIARRLGWPDNRRREALRAALSKWEASK